MAIRVDTYALALGIDHLIERGIAQTLTAPIRHGSTGALVAPSAGTVTITRPDLTELVSAAAVTITDSTATYALSAPAATETPAAGWVVTWALTIGGNPYTFRHPAILCQYVPRCPVSVADMLTRVPSLLDREPQGQRSTSRNGDGTGWQAQLDAAWYEWLRELKGNGRPIWRLKSAVDYFDRVLVRACQLAVQTIATGPEGAFVELSKQLYFDSTKAAAAVKLTYDDDTTGLRRGASPIVRLAPVGRPSW